MDEVSAPAGLAATLPRVRALYAEMTPNGTLLARRLLRQALAGSSDADQRAMAEGWAFLADILTCDYLNRWNGANRAELAEAESAVDKALRLDPDLPLAHYAEAFIHRAKGEHAVALAAFERAIALNSDFTRAYAQKANELMYLGRLDEVQPLVEKAIIGTPSDSLSLGMFYWIIGRAHFFAGCYTDAIPWLRQSVEIRPNLYYNRLYLVSAHALAGDRESAEAALRDFNDRFPGYTLARVSQNEQTNPNNIALVVEGRRRFHQGLISAGMKEV